MGPALGPPALSSAETVASWGNVLYLNQARGLLSHGVSFRMQSWYSLRLSSLCFLGHVYQNGTHNGLKENQYESSGRLRCLYTVTPS